MSVTCNKHKHLTREDHPIIEYGFLVAVLHKHKTVQNMVNEVSIFDSLLGADLFNEEVQVLLTDRDSEFVYADEMEMHI